MKKVLIITGVLAVVGFVGYRIYSKQPAVSITFKKSGGGIARIGDKQMEFPKGQGVTIPYRFGWVLNANDGGEYSLRQGKTFLEQGKATEYSSGSYVKINWI